MAIRTYTLNWVFRQGARVWTYGMLSHMVTYGSGAGDWRSGREGRQAGLATNPIVIAAMAGFASGAVDAFIEDQSAIGLVSRVTYKPKEPAATHSAGKTNTSAAKTTTTQPQRQKEKASSSTETAGWRKNQTKKSPRSPYTPPSRQKASSSNILPYLKATTLDHNQRLPRPRQLPASP